MNKRQNSKANMYRTTSNCLTGHAAQVATIPALDAAATELENNIEAIEDQAELQETVTDGVAADKGSKRLSLCRTAANTAGQVRAWAVATSNTLMAEKMRISYSDLTGMVDGQLAERCQTIHDDANTNLAALANYGVTAGKLTNLQTLIDNYAASSTAPRDAKTEGIAATIALEDLFKKTDSLLKDQVDLLMNDFMDSDPQFFNQYKAARTIQDAATGATQIKGTVTAAANGTPLEGATVSTIVNGEPVAFVTTAQGKYKLLLPPGTYSITVTLTGYAPQTINNVIVAIGEAKLVDVQLVVI